jgi:peptide-methionine (R)-S-oxide reductase
MKRFAAALCFQLALAFVAGCSDNAGHNGTQPTPYTQETADIDPALQPTSNPAETDMPDPHDTTTPADTPADSDGGNDLTGPLAAQTTGKVELTDAQWRAILSTEEYYVLRQSGTERRFTGRYLNNNNKKGAYHCVGCGNKLYDGEHKFHSGCGWPSFFQEIEKDAITTHVDRSVGMVRTEMRCGRCDGHLGHIFADAPDQPTGLRHCVNGTALIFVPDDADIKDVFREHRKAFAGK